MDWHHYIEIFTAIFVIVDPLGAVPIFLSVTADEDARQRARTALVASVVFVIAMVLATFIGEPILKFFGIRIASFQVGGGILILLLAISMLNAKISPARQTPEEAQEAVAKSNVAVVPLAIPLLSGPAAFSTVIIYSTRSEGWSDRAFIVASIVLVALIIWILFRLSIPLSHRLGQTGVNTVTRVMGLILAAIAIEFISAGLLQLFPALN